MTTSKSPSGSADAVRSEHAVIGLLSRDGRDYRVELHFATTYSLWLDYAGERPQPASGIFSGLRVETGKHTVETGRCEVIVEQENNNDRFRLVVLEGIHDFRKLLLEGRIDVIDNTARNLPLVLDYKNNIDADFREFAADVAYDLSVYRNFFDRLDEEYADEPEAVAKRIQSGILTTLGPELYACLNRNIARMETLITDFDGQQHSHHGYYLRKLIWGELLSAPFVARTNLKPRGYVGDSEMMAMCYRNAYEGNSTFGKLMHKFPVDAPGAQAVRNRRELIPQLARGLLDRFHSTVEAPFRLLSVACGPARELSDIFVEPADCERVHVSLLDQDAAALREASVVIEGVEARLNSKLRVNFVRESVRTLLSTRELQASWGDFHFIYSMGLFDYLTPPVASAVLRKLYALLLPGGEMAIGNFHDSNPNRYYMDYWLDWPVIHRTEEEFTALADGLDGAETWIEFDDTGVQMMLRIRKQQTWAE